MVYIGSMPPICICNYSGIFDQNFERIQDGCLINNIYIDYLIPFLTLSILVL